MSSADRDLVELFFRESDSMRFADIYEAKKFTTAAKAAILKDPRFADFYDSYILDGGLGRLKIDGQKYKVIELLGKRIHSLQMISVSAREAVPIKYEDAAAR